MAIKNFQLMLRIFGAIIFVVSASHLFLGLRADALLGANISSAVLAEPTLDSQNRFYGAAFAIYGVLLLLCATDIRRYEPVLRWAMAVFFIGGLARLVSIVIVGLPAPLILGLTAIELLAPPLLYVAMRAALAEAD